MSEAPTYLYDRELDVDVKGRAADGDPEERSRPDRRQEPAEEHVESIDQGGLDLGVAQRPPRAGLDKDVAQTV